MANLQGTHALGVLIAAVVLGSILAAVIVAVVLLVTAGWLFARLWRSKR